MSDRLRELEYLVSEINTSDAWKIAMRELKTKADLLDETWQSTPKEKVFELQVTKLAIMEILTIVDEWQDELDDIKEQVKDDKSPEGIQEGDFDNE